MTYMFAQRYFNLREACMKRTKLTLLAALTGGMVLAGCTDINSPTNRADQRQREGTALGAATGALLGILGGQNASSRRNAAIVGGVLGAAAGNALGAKLDAQAADLQANISDGRIQIVNEGDQLRVVMPQDILFAVDSANVSSVLRSDLVAVADSLNRFPDSRVIVFGHTDNTGSASHNLDLSQRRAQAVSNILVNNGVSAGRVRSIGRGEDEPVATNLTAAGRAQNRRVEIVIRPNG